LGYNVRNGGRQHMISAISHTLNVSTVCFFKFQNTHWWQYGTRDAVLDIMVVTIRPFVEHRIEDTESICILYGLLEGWNKTTNHERATELFSSTMKQLANLYPELAREGFQFDDE